MKLFTPFFTAFIFLVSQFTATLSIPTLPPPFTQNCVVGAYNPNSKDKVKTYIVNLDESPTTRWNEVMKDKADGIIAMLAEIKVFVGEIVGSEVFDLIDKYVGSIAETLPGEYGKEIEGIATATGLPLGEVVLYNIFYEVFTFCTSIVAQNEQGEMFHARNLDFGLFLGWDQKNNTWSLTERLRPIVVNVDFRRSNKTVYQAVHFAGYVGIITGMKPQAFSISMDERFNVDGGYIGLIEWILLGERDVSWIGFLARDTLEKAANFSEAAHMLSDGKVLAPCYFILGGKAAGEGMVITRSREKTLDQWNMNPKNGTWFLVETNYDHWEDPLFLDDRRTPANHCMNNLTQKGVSLEGLYNVLSTRPNLNKLTAYTAVMQVAAGKLETYLRYCPDPCWPW